MSLLLVVGVQRGIIRCKPVSKNDRNYTKSIRKNSKSSGSVSHNAIYCHFVAMHLVFALFGMLYRIR